MRRTGMLLAVLALMVAGMACAQDEGTPEATDADELSLAFADVEEAVEGNVATLTVDVTGLEIVAADGDTSGDTGHLHFFIDREPIDEGEVVPKEAGIVHSADNPTTLYGLSVGEHEVTVVAGDGAHERIGDAEDSVTIEVEGPSVDATAPATLDEGDDLEIELVSEGVEIVAADGDESGESGHYHVLVDPKSPPKAGELIPEPKEGEIYHSAEDSVTIEGLEEGEHTIFVVLGDGKHMAFDPAVMDKLTVTVS